MLLLNIIKNMFTCQFSSSFCFSVYLKLKAIAYDKTPEIISVLQNIPGIFSHYGLYALLAPFPNVCLILLSLQISYSKQTRLSE